MRIKLIVTMLHILIHKTFDVELSKHEILGPDEFKEVFEIAAPGKDFEVYSEGHFKRKK